MNDRGHYVAVPLDVEADIDSFETDYASNNISVDKFDSRFIKLVTIVVSLLAFIWIGGLCVVVYRDSNDQSIIRLHAQIKPEFAVYSIVGVNSTGTDHSVNPSISGASGIPSQPDHPTQTDNQPNEQSNNHQETSEDISSTAIDSQQPNNQAEISKLQPTQPTDPPIPQTKPSITPVPVFRRTKPGSLAPADFNFKGKCGVDGYRCVVSFGLYGQSEKYVDGAIENARLMPQIYDGWRMRVYHDSSVPKDALDMLRSLDVELIVADQSINGTTAGMFWRFLVAADPSVDRYIIRDTDSRLNARERAAVDEWLASGYSMHIMRDHPTGHMLPMNGGLWGGTKGVQALLNMSAYINGWTHNSVGADQNLLNNKVYPHISTDHLAHDAYTCLNYINSIGFPTQRSADYQHVGQVYVNGETDQEAIDMFVRGKEAPKKCRRNPEWTYG